MRGGRGSENGQFLRSSFLDSPFNQLNKDNSQTSVRGSDMFNRLLIGMLTVAHGHVV